MERREWKHNFTDGEHHIREHGNGDCIAHTRSFDRAEQIVTEHNQHTALVEQRDLLVAALREIAAFDDESASRKLEETGSYKWFDEPGAVRAARTALATAEQGEGRDL